MSEPLTVEKVPVSKYLVANISGDTVIVCLTVTENELIEGIQKILHIAGETGFNMDDFYHKGSAGNYRRLHNGTMLQFLYIGEE